MSSSSGNAAGLGSVLTLKDAVEEMGDAGKSISYLKVDIEGSEIKAIPEWIDSGVLDQVNQFGIELHTGQTSLGSDDLIPKISELLTIIRKLHNIGFRLISNSNNDCVGKSDDYNKQYFNLMEVVFYKDNWQFTKCIKCVIVMLV